MKPDQVTEAVLDHVNFGHVTELSDTRYRTAAYELTFQTEAVQASREIQTAKDAAEHVLARRLRYGMESTRSVRMRIGIPISIQPW